MDAAFSFIEIVFLLGEVRLARVLAIPHATIAEAAVLLASGAKVKAIKVIYEWLKEMMLDYNDHLEVAATLIRGVSKERSNKKAGRFLISFVKNLHKLS
jgi:hypothetical protein